MPSGKFCPACQRKNPIEAAYCDCCRTPLEGGPQYIHSTGRLTGMMSQVLMQPAEYFHQMSQLPLNALLFFVMDSEEPVMIRDCVKVVLGRQIHTASVPALDLTRYESGGFGISRQHAVVMNMLDHYTIQDLKSTNGTWVNGRRLAPGKSYPLSSGSEVRLGRLVLHVYFRLRAVPEDIVLLYQETRDPARRPAGLTPDEVTRVVYPYLQALADVQHALEKARGQDQSPISINTISASRQDLPIGVSLSGASDAVRIAKEWIQPWRRDHAGFLQMPDDLTGIETTALYPGEAFLGTADRRMLAAVSKPTDPVSSTAACLVMEGPQASESGLESAIVDLAASILEECLPPQCVPDREQSLAALVPPLTILASSQLHVYCEARRPD